MYKPMLYDAEYISKSQVHKNTPYIPSFSLIY